MSRESGGYPDGIGSWTFLTNHGHVMVCLARRPDMRVREIAEEVGITERAAHRILSDLVEAGYVSRHRIGSRNRYELHPELPLRHSVEGHHQVGELLDALAGHSDRAKPRRRNRS